MPISPADIKALREATGVGILQAKQALEETDGDVNKAVEQLRKQGQKVANKKQDRTAGEGWVGMYVHHNGKVAAMVELRCETDFVGRNTDFQQLANQLAMHVAAAAPLYVSEQQVPADAVAKEEEIARAQLAAEDKPAEMVEKIVPGKLKKYYADTCLLLQPFVLDDKKTVQALINEAILKLGEKIEVTRFARFAF